MTKLKRGRIYKRPAEVPEPDLEQPPDPQPLSLRWQLADWMQPPSRAIDGGQLAGDGHSDQMGCDMTGANVIPWTLRRAANEKGARRGAIVGQGLGDLHSTPLSVPGSR